MTGWIMFYLAGLRPEAICNASYGTQANTTAEHEHQHLQAWDVFNSDEHETLSRMWPRLKCENEGHFRRQNNPEKKRRMVLNTEGCSSTV